jgi:hypothetical protein
MLRQWVIGFLRLEGALCPYIQRFDRPQNLRTFEELNSSATLLRKQADGGPPVTHSVGQMHGRLNFEAGSTEDTAGRHT